jgi:hypothetical protein
VSYDAGKLRELVLYVARKSQNDRRFGKTKLIKLLAWSDFVAFGRLGEPITGATYRKLEFGPAPKELPHVLSDLKRDGRIHQIQQQEYSYKRERIVADDTADTDLFTAEQLAIVDEVIAKFRDWNNSDLSDESHREFVGWAIVDEGDTIPYHTVFLSPAPITEADREHARRVAAEDGLAVV